MLFGREQLKTQIEQKLVEASNGEGGAMVIRGARGMGKTAALSLAHDMAQRLDVRVMKMVGLKSEVDLPYGALQRMLAPILTASQRQTPDAEILRALCNFRLDRDPMRLELAMACLNLLSDAASERPILLTIDDSQWLDAETAAQVEFVAVRLSREAVMLMITAEDTNETHVEFPGVDEYALPQMSAVNVAEIIKEACDCTPSLQTVDVMLRASMGNPGAVCALTSELTKDQLSGRAALPEPLPMAANVKSELLDRFERLSDETKLLMLLLAVGVDVEASCLLSAAPSLGIKVPRSLQEAETAGLVSVQRAEVSFLEPLMREAISSSAAFSERCKAHKAIAEALDAKSDLDLILWHKAQATVGQNEALANEIEKVAQSACRRRGYAFVADLLERAAQLSESSRERGRRLYRASRYAMIAGHETRSSSLSMQALTESDLFVGDEMCVRSILAIHAMQRARMRSAFEQTTHIPWDVNVEMPESSPRACLLNASIAACELGQLEAGMSFGREATGLVAADEYAFPYRFGIAGHVSQDGLADATRESPEFADHLETLAGRDDPLALVHAWRMASWLGDSQAALHYADTGLKVARARGGYGVMPELAVDVATSLFELERIGSVEAEAYEALRLAREFGHERIVVRALTILSSHMARLGRKDDFDRYANEGKQRAIDNGLTFYAAMISHAESVLALALNQNELAFSLLVDTALFKRNSHPLVSLWAIPDLIEASYRTRSGAIELGSVFDEYMGWAKRSMMPQTCALAYRAQAFLSDGQVQLEHFNTALTYHDRSRDQYSRARTLLSYGEALRRSRQPTEARIALQRAMGAFERQGAAPWATRARNELRAAGMSIANVGSSEIDLDSLTPQELQVTRLASEGMSNREIAAQLFISHRTVEYHLHKVFAKLNISSRNELIIATHGNSAIDVRESAFTEDASSNRGHL